MDKIAALIGKLFGVFIVTLISVAFNGYFVKLFWNWVAVSVLHLQPISWLEGCGFILLVSFLQGGVRATYKD